MPNDSFTIKSVTSELNKTLSGGKINKVYQPEKDETVLQIYSNNKNYRLLLSCGANYPRNHKNENVKEKHQTH